MGLPLSLICKKVVALSKTTGKFIHSQQRGIGTKHIEVKSVNSFVTYVDKQAEKKLVSGLKKILPGSGFITEEGTQRKSTKENYVWIIDPLDGTTNFIHGVPCYCISIALYQTSIKRSDWKGLIGVIHDPVNMETYTAISNQGAYVNGKRITVTKTSKLKSSLLVTGFPTYNYSRMTEYLSLFKDLMRRTRGLRRLGSAALDLAYVACGRFEAFYEYSLNPWDVAAGALIVEEAGGKISDFKGNQNWLFGKEIIASNTETHQQLLSKCKKYFK